VLWQPTTLLIKRASKRAATTRTRTSEREQATTKLPHPIHQYSTNPVYTIERYSTPKCVYPKKTLESNMDELFNFLSSTARIDKSKRKKKNKAEPVVVEHFLESSSKKTHSESKQKHIHQEQINAFRNRLGISLSHKNKHDSSIPDPISSFAELEPPAWWTEKSTFQSIKTSVVRNIESGRWINPTPIQMQAIPSLINRRDVLGTAPTGSGKSGAFIIPALFLTSVTDAIFYKKGDKDDQSQKIRALLLAPSRELASQLHREVERLGEGKVGGIRSALLSKSNAATICANSSSTKSRGLDVLVSTPLRLVECLKEDHGRKLDLGSVRIIILDEAGKFSALIFYMHLSFIRHFHLYPCFDQMFCIKTDSLMLVMGRMRKVK